MLETYCLRHFVHDRQNYKFKVVQSVFSVEEGIVNKFRLRCDKKSRESYIVLRLRVSYQPRINVLHAKSTNNVLVQMTCRRKKVQEEKYAGQ